MLQIITNLKGFTIRATDGKIGTAEQLYFDDETWAVRYLVVDTGGWLGGRRVLVSPFSISNVNWGARSVDVSLTKQQVEGSPYIHIHHPVSRQHEAAYLGHFGYPNYWKGPKLWGTVHSPAEIVIGASDSVEAVNERAKAESKTSHLRTTGAVRGYDLQGTDGEIGHVCGFVLDDETWAIRYIEVATRQWWPGKKVLISPSWIQRVTWISSKIHVALSRQAIQSAPEYVDSIAITREFEDGLYLHYGRAPYWQKDAELRDSLVLSNA